jgi:replicative DNA helicase
MAELNDYKGYLQDEVERCTKRSKGGLYICPICGSGTGANGTGAFGIYDNGARWKCQSCGEGGDIFDLFEIRDKLSKTDAARAVMARYGGGTSTAQRPVPSNGYKTGKASSSSTAQDEPKRHDYSEYLNKCAEALEGSAGELYLKGRGFTLDTMRRFKLGYDAACYNKSLQKQAASIVIPYSGSMTYYASRPIDEKAYDKPLKAEAGSEPVFNAAALYAAPVCFIVESQLCAISIAQEGGTAVAIGGGGTRHLLNQLEKKPTEAALIVSLDNDEPGEAKEKTDKKAAGLLEELKAAGYYALQANISGEYKDPNERLQHDAAGLRAAIKATTEAAQIARDAERQEQIEAYRQESAEGYIKAFTDGIAASIDTPAIPTGFTGLDKLLEGGLYEGLYIIGAISSLGKTTFALQMADQIAASGQDVIIFSLEMARNELIAKSISRLTYKGHQAQGLPRGAAKTTRGITTGKRYAAYSDTEMTLIESATKAYAAIGRHIWIKEGVGDMGVEQVREAVQRHISLTGRKPVIVIDYLQILAPYEIRATDKQNTDKAVLELKRISRDYKIPVIGISSFNRDNYTAPVNMAAFKESGAIEYSSDVLIGLQYAGMDYQEGEADKAREKRIRELIKTNAKAAREGQGQEIDLKVLKNRNGAKDTSDPLTFYPMFNIFIEHPEGFTVIDDAPDVFTGNHRRK